MVMGITRKDLAPGIVVYGNVMPNVETFIPELEEAVSGGAVKWGDPYIRQNNEDVVNREIRDLQVLGIDYEQSKTLKESHSNPKDAFDNILGNRIYTALDFPVKHYIRDFSAEWTFHDIYNVMKYSKGHFFKNHIDDGLKFHRRVSFSFYPNDDYIGGEITFERFGIEYKPKANEILIFPSTYVYNHSVKPIEEGTRYAVVSWLH
jgi:hypothetical protein